MMTDSLQQLAELASAIADRTRDTQDAWCEHLSFEEWEALGETAAALRAYATMATTEDPAAALRMANAVGEHTLRVVLARLHGCQSST